MERGRSRLVVLLAILAGLAWVSSLISGPRKTRKPDQTSPPSSASPSAEEYQSRRAPDRGQSRPTVTDPDKAMLGAVELVSWSVVPNGVVNVRIWNRSDLPIRMLIETTGMNVGGQVVAIENFVPVWKGIPPGVSVYDYQFEHPDWRKIERANLRVLKATVAD